MPREGLYLAMRLYSDPDGIECPIYYDLTTKDSTRPQLLDDKPAKGIMVWACFAGDKKGPIVIWNSAWGTLNSSNFTEHIVPKIDQFNIDLWENHQVDALLMQDGAPCHWSYETTGELEGLDVDKNDHPPISPDLNPQDNLWYWLKGYVSDRCGSSDIRQPNLISIILEGWDALPANILENLVCSMPGRVHEVIEREEGATRY
jgi:hypothetical protein